MTQTHDAQRPRVGRPMHERPQALIRIEADEPEQQEIQAWLTPRERTLALLDAAAVMRLRGEDDVSGSK